MHIKLKTMKFNTVMPATLKPFYKKELNDASNAFLEGNLQQCWQHLERAHILGQPYPYEHSLTHFRMLKFGIKIKDKREILGQIPRLVFGGVKSFVGKIPTGNTGGANIPPLRSMDIPLDLLTILRTHSNNETSVQ